jgi:hypothetical protein
MPGELARRAAITCSRSVTPPRPCSGLIHRPAPLTPPRWEMLLIHPYPHRLFAHQAGGHLTPHLPRVSWSVALPDARTGTDGARI